MHWTEALTYRLKGKVKMVGSTISCAGVYDVPAVPHVQSYLVAVDQIGFNVLRKTVNSVPLMVIQAYSMEDSMAWQLFQATIRDT